MTRIDTVRTQISRLTRNAKFQPFALITENGDRVVVEHPENVAFDPTENGRDALYIISNKLQHYTTLSAVTSVVLLDAGELAR